MGIIYLGPYADIVNEPVEHEGYAARLMPDGSLVGGWGGEYGWDGHVGLVGACDCGWRSDRIHPPGDQASPEYTAAEDDFETQHLDPLVEQARQRAWPEWAARTSRRIDRVAALVAEGRLRDADVLLADLAGDIGHYRNVLDKLRDRAVPPAPSPLDPMSLPPTPSRPGSGRRR